MTFEEWSLDWSCSDQSNNSPQQGNKMIVESSPYCHLLSSATAPASEQTRISQDIVDLQQTCRRLIHLIWSLGLGDPSTPWIATSTAADTTTATNSTRKRHTATNTTHNGTQENSEDRDNNKWSSADGNKSSQTQPRGRFSTRSAPQPP